MAAIKQKLLRRWEQEEIYAEATNSLEQQSEQFISDSDQELLDDDLWCEVKMYFSKSEWEEMALIERQRCKNLLTRYNYMLENEMPVEKPFFMTEATPEEPGGKRPRIQQSRSPRVGERSSLRLRESTSKNYYESPRRAPCLLTRSDSLSPPVVQDPSSVSLLSSPTRSNDLISSSSPPPLIQDLPGSSLGSSSSDTTSRTAPPLARRPGGRIPDKKFRTFDQMVYGLPVFGERSRNELKKIRMNMVINPIHEDCKVHIRRLTNGDEYLTRKEWDSYCKGVCDAFPNLKNEGNKYWESFKVGLQKSFSAERKNKKKKKSTAEATQDDEDEVAEAEPSTSNKHPLDIETELAASELKKGTCDRRAMKALLENSLRFRKVERTTLAPLELLNLYPFLAIPEMMIFDYLITIEVAIESCEKIFNDNILLLAEHFGIESTTENGKFETMLKVHDYFLSKAVKKGLKPVLIDKQEDRQSLLAMESSNIQAPFVVVLRKQNFITGAHEVRSANLLMANSLISSLSFPTVDKIMLLLLGAYVTLNTEYPSPYQQFMRALEKLVTGKPQPSKYGRSQVQYDRLMSLVQKK